MHASAGMPARMCVENPVAAIESARVRMTEEGRVPPTANRQRPVNVGRSLTFLGFGSSWHFEMPQKRIGTRLKGGPDCFSTPQTDASRLPSIFLQPPPTLDPASCPDRPHPL